MNPKTRNVIIISAAVIIIVVVASVAWVFKKAPDSVASQKVEFQLNANDLINAFTLDEAVADKLYLGKIIEITGTIDEITENLKDQKVTITIKDPGAMSGVLCEFAIGNLDTKMLKIGSPLKIKGICNGFLMDVVLTKCVVEE